MYFFTWAQRKIRAAKKRSELRKAAKGGGEGGLPSRALADTAYAEICKKPAFHNYGRANAAGSWVSVAELSTFFSWGSLAHHNMFFKSNLSLHPPLLPPHVSFV